MSVIDAGAPVAAASASPDGRFICVGGRDVHQPRATALYEAHEREKEHRRAELLQQRRRGARGRLIGS